MKTFNRRQIVGAAKRIIKNVAELPLSEIRIESDPRNDLSIDSLDVWNLLYECEQKFDMAIPDEEVNKFNTLKDGVDYIHDELFKQGRAPKPRIARAVAEAAAGNGR
ncbi:MAG: acyl carrier protein [Rickettsiales bacterium]|jgi:acyl carrier protein|nr:acyl carrier protein [Rickettsiales bacterium]